uniref:SWIM-type domain-containing protein n=1 Tax=Lactuca sativa TaxID=4236 RepID=A0A9R1USZ4_LACSA|nr:hypothetical protein LSAT_V11C800400910 [Lactuca sativa]
MVPVVSSREKVSVNPPRAFHVRVFPSFYFLGPFLHKNVNASFYLLSLIYIPKHPSTPHLPPDIKYIGGEVRYVDYVDIDEFYIHELDAIMLDLGYPDPQMIELADESPVIYYHFRIPNGDFQFGFRALENDQDVINLSKFIRNNKLIEVYKEHGKTNLLTYFMSPNAKGKVVIEELPENDDQWAEVEAEVHVESPLRNMNHVNDEPIGEYMYLILFGSKSDAFSPEYRRVEDNDHIEGCYNTLPVNDDEQYNELFDNLVDYLLGSNEDAEEYERDDGSQKHDEEYEKDEEFCLNVESNVEGACINNFHGHELEDMEVINNKELKSLDEGSDQDRERRALIKNLGKEKRCNLGLNLEFDWFIRTLNKTHTCLQIRKLRVYTASLICKKIIDQVEGDPKIPLRAIQDQFQKTYQVGISMDKVFRAKDMARKHVTGDYTKQFELLRDYALELQATNLDTIVKIDVCPNGNPDSPTRQFRRIYVCLGPLKKGFKACLRDLVGLDGAFMKGPFSGHVLIVVGFDSNNVIYPLAYAIVESENTASWKWFLENLGDDLELGSNSDYTFISDRQKVEWGDKYLVTRAFQDQHVVNVRNQTCTCIKLELMGIPCRNAIATLNEMSKDPEAELEIYKPKKKRKQSEGEKLSKRQRASQDDGVNEMQGESSQGPTNEGVQKLSRKHISVTCSKCKNKGHISRNCKGQGENQSKK